MVGMDFEWDCIRNDGRKMPDLLQIYTEIENGFFFFNFIKFFKKIFNFFQRKRQKGGMSFICHQIRRNFFQIFIRKFIF